MTAIPHTHTMERAQVVEQTDSELDVCDERVISALLAQALRENPSRQQDWLALASQVSDDYERRFCLRQAGHLH